MTATMTLERPLLEEVKRTSKVRELIKQAPIISRCKCAESLSKRFAFLYDIEYDGNTPFDCTFEDLQNPGSRLAMIDPRKFEPENPEVAETAYARLVLIEARSNHEKGKITDDQLHRIIAEYGSAAQKSVQEVDSVLPFDAVLSSWWWQ